MPTSPTPQPDRPWQVVIPVKDVRHGKSRLSTLPGLGAADRVRLTRAIADDTIAAAAEAVGADRVWLVTPDRALRGRWSPAGVNLVDDPGAGLNAAVAAGLAAAPTTFRRAALLGDLPALRAADLLTALAAAAGYEDAFVPDAAGTGTVLRAGRTFVGRFGPDSAAAHAADGAVRLDLDLPRLRSDVDDPHGLELAIRLGVGPATMAALARHHTG